MCPGKEALCQWLEQYFEPHVAWLVPATAEECLLLPQCKYTGVKDSYSIASFKENQLMRRGTET